MGGLMGGIGGLFLGGLIGSLLFGGMGSGLFGGIGLMEILIIGGLVYLALSYVRRRQRMPAGPQAYATPQGADATPWQPGSQSRATATLEMPAASSDLDRGVGHIRQMDGAFDPERFADTASDFFFKVQAAWIARNMGSVRDRLTPEMHATLQKECDQLRVERRVNRLENIAVRTVEVTEAWQDGGQDFVTVRFQANLLDYTVDETSTQVIEGSRTEPVKFEEYWTFVRPVGPNPWRLSAIQQ
jgi:predicted lipid-binding transport protein (Tim44 family)